MKRKEMPKWMFKLAEGVRKDAPTLMSFGAVVGLGVTVYLAVKAKPKADEILAKRKEELAEIDIVEAEQVETENGEVAHVVLSEEDKKTLRQKANIGCGLEMAKVVGPAVIAGGTTVFLILMANRINMKRLSAMGVAYKLSSDELKKYKEKTREIVGDKKEAEIQNAAATDRMRDALCGVEDPEIIDTGKGTVLYFDKWSGRLFRSSPNAIDAAVNEVNRLALANDFASLNDFYYELGLPSCDLAEEFGFHSMNGKLMDKVVYSSARSENGQVIIDLDYTIYPRNKYDDRMI